MAAAPLGIPVVHVGRQRHPRPRVRATARLADGARGLVRGDLRALAGAAPGRPCYVTGTPIRDVGAIGPRRGPGRGWASPPDERVLLVFGGSQAVRRFNAAVAEALPRLVERVTVIHVTGDDGYAAALAGREALPEPSRAAATGRTRSCATRCWPRSRRPTSSSAGPAHRRWPR